MNKLFISMKRIGVFILCIFCFWHVNAQNVSVAEKSRLIDSSQMGQWPSVSGGSISNDGEYVSFDMQKVPVGGHTLVLQAAEGSWKKEFINASNVVFSDDSKAALFLTKDTLHLLALGGEDTRTIQDVSVFQLVKVNADEVLVYMSKNHELVIYSLRTTSRTTFTNADSYTILAGDKTLLWQTKEKDSTGSYLINIANLADGISKTIWRGRQQANNLQISGPGTAIVFTASAVDGADSLNRLHWVSTISGEDRVIYQSGINIQLEASSFDSSGRQFCFMSNGIIWYCRDDLKVAARKIDSLSSGIANNLSISRNAGVTFSRDGSRVFFQLVEKPVEKSIKRGIQVDVWGYDDHEIQSVQLFNLSRPRKQYLAMFAIDSNRIIRLEQAEESLSTITQPEMSLKYILIRNPQGSEWAWRRDHLSQVYLVSLKDGARTCLSETLKYGVNELFELSPDERCVIYYDPYSKRYQSYDIASKTVNPIGLDVPSRWTVGVFDPYPSPVMQRAAGFAGWVDNGRYVLIYDENFDIWRIDPMGSASSICLTNQYGKRHHIRFTVTNKNSGELVSGGFCKELRHGDLIALQGFNVITKEAGIFLSSISGSKDPVQLFWGKYAHGSALLLMDKARDVDKRILIRSSPDTAPNYYLVKGGGAVSPISDLQPHKEYSWYTSEVLDWKLPDGEICQGVLYKPKNLIAGKRYPVIFTYYEERSNDPFEYYMPNWLSGSNVNIPFFVNRGYMVFTPDIHFKIGYPGESTVASVVSAARYLSKRPYIDSTKMGLMGHSFGGYETNYIIAHSTIFAAAAEGAGMSDFVSDYSAIEHEGLTSQWEYEVNQCRIGKTLWQRPDLYIKNSPVFDADKIKTPLLMLQNKMDMSVLWQQGVELFMALRRLRKRCWMLQYDEGAHGLFNLNDRIDYTTRLMQFFDHYLKGAPPPIWMTEGIPAEMKGLKKGYELDTSGKRP